MSDIANNNYRDIRSKKDSSPYDLDQKRNMILEQSMGVHGSDYLSGTDPHDGPFCSIQACEATVVASAIGEGIAWVNVPLAAGQTVPGNFTQVTMASGSVLGYKSISAI